MLDNFVFNALTSGDCHLSSGTENVKFFDIEVSPFIGFGDRYKNGFDDLYQLLPAGRPVIFATRLHATEPHGWKTIATIEGTQFVLDKRQHFENRFTEPVPLDTRHVDEMVKLATLTKPGPFNKRTIEFGNYYGIFDKDQLVAMTGGEVGIRSSWCGHQ